MSERCKELASFGPILNNLDIYRENPYKLA
jgi:hypothetical protein